MERSYSRPPVSSLYFLYSFPTSLPHLQNKEGQKLQVKEEVICGLVGFGDLRVGHD